MLHNIISKMTGVEEPSHKEETPLDDSYVFFRLPICYNKQFNMVDNEVSNELELEKVYQVIKPLDDTESSDVLKYLANTYTTDVKFLQDTQTLLTRYKPRPRDLDVSRDSLIPWKDHCANVNKLKIELASDQVLSKYGLIDYEHFEYLNNIDNVLQVITMYVLISPLLAVASPLIIIIIPFFILQLKYSELTWDLYLTVLRDVGKSNPLIRMITHYGESNAEQKTYQVLTFSFYLFSIYQQISYCYKFYENFKNIHRYLISLREYFEKTLHNMRHMVSFTHELKTYKPFNTDLCRVINELMDAVHMLSPITAFEWSFSKLLGMGYVLKTFYAIKTKTSIMANVTYAYNFNTYYNYIETISSLLSAGKLNVAKLLKDKTPTIKLKEMYYPALVGEDTYASVVKNSVTLNKNLIITGPNASGKTTTIKAIFLNVLLTQQLGVGCYSGASITPFKHLHCYLNIPDTMGRDSLFQAEARRCKTMIDEISKNSGGKHLCMFDELFSGTNPDEAVTSSERFIKYITKQPNVKWVLTTHFNKLCKSLDKHKDIQNCHMEVSEEFVASYKLKKNISTVKGAFKILEDMNFPKEITQEQEQD
jgi:energy-coupling factor transporter ATP-binding protein EcfA2